LIMKPDTPARAFLFHVRRIRTIGRYYARMDVGKWMFYLGVLAYLAVQATLVAGPALRRAVPVETDDAYVCMQKTEQMRRCYFQDCPALNDLRQQLRAPSDDPKITALRHRQYGMSLVVYAPLYTTILLAINFTGLSPEASFFAFSVAGALFLGLAFSVLLRRLWGSGPAGAALLLLAFNIWPKQKLEVIAPSPLTTALALLGFAAMMRWPKKAHWRLIPWVIALVALHPIGRIYALILLAAYLWLSEGALFSRRKITVGAIVVAIVAACFVLPGVIPRPEFSYSPPPSAEGLSYWDGIHANLEYARKILRGWVRIYGGVWNALSLVCIGFFFVSPRQRRWTVTLGAMLLGMLGVSLAYATPSHPGELFRRFWLPTAILLLGAIGNAAWFLLASTLTQGRRALAGNARPKRSRAAAAALLVLLLAIGVTEALLVRDGFAKAARRIPRKLRGRTYRYSLKLDAGQPRLLYSLATDNDAVLYTDEVLLQYYLTHGGLDYGAVFYPGILNTPQEREWVHENTRLRFAACWSLIEKQPVDRAARKGALPLQSGTRITFSSPRPLPLEAVRLYFENRGARKLLRLRVQEGKSTTQEVIVPADWAGWLAVVEGGDITADGFSVEILKGDGDFRLAGCRTDAKAVLNWPWDQGFQMDFEPPGGEREIIEFESARLLPGLGYPLKVLADQGSAVLAEILRQTPSEDTRRRPQTLGNSSGNP